MCALSSPIFLKKAANHHSVLAMSIRIGSRFTESHQTPLSALGYRALPLHFLPTPTVATSWIDIGRLAPAPTTSINELQTHSSCMVPGLEDCHPAPALDNEQASNQ